MHKISMESHPFHSHKSNHKSMYVTVIECYMWEGTGEMSNIEALAFGSSPNVSLTTFSLD
jgi:hypothetical protein